MDKDEARDILNEWINKETQDVYGNHIDLSLPIVDDVVYSEWHRKNGLKSLKEDENTSLVQYTFRHLIKIAYGLKDEEV
jgi:hypothetical protein